MLLARTELPVTPILLLQDKRALQEHGKLAA